MADPNMDDPRWTDMHALQADMLRVGLITRTSNGQVHLRTFGWMALTALAALAEKEGTATRYPGLQRALQRAWFQISVGDDD